MCNLEYKMCHTVYYCNTVYVVDLETVSYVQKDYTTKYFFKIKLADKSVVYYLGITAATKSAATKSAATKSAATKREGENYIQREGRREIYRERCREKKRDMQREMQGEKERCKIERL